MNDESSRSHTIFQLHIESRKKNSDDQAVRVSCLNLVDLAGSERQSLTKSTGDRLVEGCHINKSLLTLGKVIRQLSEKKTPAHIPYRDSKLTRILQPALGGNARTAIVCNVTPSNHHIDETKSTLQFANRAKLIENTAHVNEIVDDQTRILRLQREVDILKAEREKCGA
eukprot:18165_1